MQYFYRFVYFLLSLFCIINDIFFQRKTILQSLLPFYKHYLASLKIQSGYEWPATLSIWNVAHLLMLLITISRVFVTFVIVLGRQQRFINLSSCQSTFFIRYFYVPYKGENVNLINLYFLLSMCVNKQFMYHNFIVSMFIYYLFSLN